MIESIKDLNLDTLDPHDKDVLTKLNTIFAEKLNISLDELRSALSVSLKNKSEEFASEIPNIAPYGHYENLLEDNNSMISFLKDEATKLENWVPYTINEEPSNTKLLKINFINSSVDDGDVLSGVVLLSTSGKIRHAFAQISA